MSGCCVSDQWRGEEMVVHFITHTHTHARTHTLTDQIYIVYKSKNRDHLINNHDAAVKNNYT